MRKRIDIPCHILKWLFKASGHNGPLYENLTILFLEERPLAAFCMNNEVIHMYPLCVAFDKDIKTEDLTFCTCHVGALVGWMVGRCADGVAHLPIPNKVPGRKCRRDFADSLWLLAEDDSSLPSHLLEERIPWVRRVIKQGVFDSIEMQAEIRNNGQMRIVIPAVHKGINVLFKYMFNSVKESMALPKSIKRRVSVSEEGKLIVEFLDQKAGDMDMLGRAPFAVLSYCENQIVYPRINNEQTDDGDCRGSLGGPPLAGNGNGGRKPAP